MVATQYFLPKATYPGSLCFFRVLSHQTKASHFPQTYFKKSQTVKILKLKTKIFIGNENVPKDKVQLLFGDSIHIKTPKINSYNEIDRILCFSDLCFDFTAT